MPRRAQLRQCCHCGLIKLVRPDLKTCSKECGYAYTRAKIEKRFWAKVDKSGGPDACWPWLGFRNAKGYGSAHVRLNEEAHRKIGAHQYSFFLKNGYLPLMTCHTCDNPPCCNDAHLFAGSGKINSDDKVAKDRQTKGEDNPRSKLTEIAVAEIRKRYIPRDRVNSARALAREFGVSSSTILKAAKNLKWKHVGVANAPTP